MLDALSARVLEMAFEPPGFYTSKEPGLAVLFLVPGVLDRQELNLWMYRFGGNELLAEAYAKYNLHHVGPVTILGAEPLMSTKSLATLDGLKGLKVRSAPGLSTDLFTKLGMSVVNLGPGEIYSALDTGVVDAVEWIGVQDDWVMGLHEVAEYVLWPSFHTPAATAGPIVNMDAWNELPDDLKVAFEWASLQGVHDLMLSNEAADYRSLKDMVDYGLIHQTSTEADLARVEVLGLEVLTEYKSKSPFAAKAVDSLFAFLNVMALRN